VLPINLTIPSLTSTSNVARSSGKAVEVTLRIIVRTSNLMSLSVPDEAGSASTLDPADGFCGTDLPPFDGGPKKPSRKVLVAVMIDLP